MTGVFGADSDGNFPLFNAVRHGDLELVAELLSDGAEIDALNGPEKKTALLCAVEDQRTEVAEFLLNAGACPDLIEAPVPELDLPRYPGTHDYLMATASLLLDEPENPAVGPLHAAVIRGHLPLVRLLLQHGADVNASTAGVGSPLRLAYRLREEGRVSWLHGWRLRRVLRQSGAIVIRGDSWHKS